MEEKLVLVPIEVLLRYRGREHCTFSKVWALKLFLFRILLLLQPFIIERAPQMILLLDFAAIIGLMSE